MAIVFLTTIDVEVDIQLSKGKAENREDMFFQDSRGERLREIKRKYLVVDLLSTLLGLVKLLIRSGLLYMLRRT